MTRNGIRVLQSICQLIIHFIFKLGEGICLKNLIANVLEVSLILPIAFVITCQTRGCQVSNSAQSASCAQVLSFMDSNSHSRTSWQ